MEFLIEVTYCEDIDCIEDFYERDEAKAEYQDAKDLTSELLYKLEANNEDIDVEMIDNYRWNIYFAEGNTREFYIDKVQDVCWKIYQIIKEKNCDSAYFDYKEA